MRINKPTKEDMNMEIIEYEENWWKRGVLEAIHIRKEKPSLNKDLGRFNLSKIWDNVIVENRRHPIGRININNVVTDTASNNTDED